MRIGRTFGLCQNVCYTHTFKDSTHSTTGYHTSTMRSRLDENLSPTKLGRLFMRNCSLQYRDTRQVFLSSFNSFGNGSCYFTSFTQSPTDDTFFISYYHNSRKAECSTTFGYLGHTIDSHQSIFEFYIASNFNSIINSSHND